MPKINVYVTERLAEAVQHYGISVSSVCQKALEQEVRGQLPLLEFTPRARQILHAAAKEAEARGHTYIGTEHLLLGLLAERNGIAAQVLQQLGVTGAIGESLDAIMESDGYTHGSNRVVDRDGNFLGYLVSDAEGHPMLVGEAGRPIEASESGEHSASE